MIFKTLILAGFLLITTSCANRADSKATDPETPSLSGEVETFAGVVGVSGSLDGTGTSAQFYRPRGLALDSSGNLYVADTMNHVIRKVTSAGVVTTLAGTAGAAGSTDGTGSAARFNLPVDLALDSAGNIYVTDTGNLILRKITPSGVVTTLAGTAGASGSLDGTGAAARFSNIRSIAIDSSDNIYLADSMNQLIRKVTTAGVVTTFAGSAGAQGTTDGNGSAARFRNPYGIAVDSSGNVYVADSENYTIRKITASADVTTIAGSAGVSGATDGNGSSARLGLVHHLDVDSSGNIYFTEYNNSVVRKITPSADVTTYAGISGNSGSVDSSSYLTSTFNSPIGIVVASTGEIYIADTLNHLIRKLK